MFRTENSVGMLKTIAMIASLAILLWSFGTASLRSVEAASVISFADLITDSAPSAAAVDHTFTFTATDGLTAGQTLTLTFPTGFNLTGIIEDDVDLDINATPVATAGSVSSGVWGVSILGQVITITSSDTTIAASDVIEIRIGTNAVDSGTGVNQIDNPAAEGSYKMTLGGTMSDLGVTHVVILSEVTVTANVDNIFNFAVTGVAAGGTVNGETITGTAGSTTIPFGSLTSGVASTSAQILSVSTNSANGYMVTVQVDGDLISSTGATIDGFSNGSDTNVPASWTVPSATLGSKDTYGHWGITSDDATTTRAVEFGLQEFISASTTPRVVMSHNGPTFGVGVGVGTTTVGYKIEISALQEAGSDYVATLTYVATPTF